MGSVNISESGRLLSVALPPDFAVDEVPAASGRRVWYVETRDVDGARVRVVLGPAAAPLWALTQFEYLMAFDADRRAFADFVAQTPDADCSEMLTIYKRWFMAEIAARLNVIPGEPPGAFVVSGPVRGTEESDNG